MRQVSRLVHRGRHAARRRPRPRWWRPAGIGAAALALMLVLGGGFWYLGASGALEHALGAVRERALALGEEVGLVVRNVYSQGRERTSERDLLRLLEAHQGRSVFAVDPVALREQLETLTWVRTATVARRLPDTLWIRLEEHQPLALWHEGGERRLVNDAGEVIPARDLTRFHRLPVISGQGAPARARQLFEMLAVEPLLAQRVTAASLVGNRRWNVYLDHRIEVRLPENDPEEAWRFLAVQQRETALLARAVEAIDLRQSNWLVLRLVDEAVTLPRPSGGQGA
ncbi:MAG TPA: cell division protein FtsQ/DivIB [Geminicoccaceae bacterium]|nr:cell division protein FtsQ/DivIB [Geminicoccaceae bacterium]